MTEFNKYAYLKSLHGRELSTGAYRVLITVLDYANEYGENAHPGIARLADDCVMGASTVRRHLNWLVEHGYLVLDSRGHNVKNFAVASVYHVELPPNIERKATAQSEEPTAQNRAPTAQYRATYRSVLSTQPLNNEHLSDLEQINTTDQHTPDQETPDPDEPEELENNQALTRGQDENESVPPPSLPNTIDTTTVTWGDELPPECDAPACPDPAMDGSKLCFECHSWIYKDDYAASDSG